MDTDTDTDTPVWYVHFFFFLKGRYRSPLWRRGASLLAAPREVADKRGQVVGGRGAKATDDYTQCISAVCVFTRITFSQMAYRVSVSVFVSRIMWPSIIYHICRVVQQTYIAGPYTTYILVCTVYTSRNVYRTYTGFTLYGRGAFAQYTTYIVLYTVYTSRNVCETYTKFKVI